MTNKQPILTAGEIQEYADKAVAIGSGCESMGMLINRLIGLPTGHCIELHVRIHKALNEALTEIMEPYIDEYGLTAWKYQDWMLN